MSHRDFKDTGDIQDRTIEEMAELTHAICKGRRFGWTNHHPDTPEVTNIDQAQNEINDVLDSLLQLSIYLMKLSMDELLKAQNISSKVADSET